MTDLQDLATKHTPAAPVFPDCALTALTRYGLIRISGEDKREFLQGQFTNDIKKVSETDTQLSGYCSAKGRMLASFLVFQRGGDLYIQLPLDRKETILKRLGMFVLRSQVSITDASESLSMLGVSGTCLETLLPDAPTVDWHSVTDAELTLIRLPGDRPRCLVIGPDEALVALWNALSTSAEPTTADFWTLMDIRAGIPGVYKETVEAFVPQMANLQLVNGVSFTKGCYTGQEVVARMQYLGKLKRRMYRVRIPVGEVPVRGTELFSASSESGQGAGRIVQATVTEDGTIEALAVMQISSAEANDVHLENEQGRALDIVDLPYRFEETASA